MADIPLCWRDKEETQKNFSFFDTLSHPVELYLSSSSSSSRRHLLLVAVLGEHMGPSRVLHVIHLALRDLQTLLISLKEAIGFFNLSNQPPSCQGLPLHPAIPSVAVSAAADGDEGCRWHCRPWPPVSSPENLRRKRDKGEYFLFKK